MNRPTSGPAWTLLLAVLCISPVAASGDESPQQCAAIDDDGARLACYDGIFRKPGASGTGAEAAAATTAAGTVAATTSPGTTVVNPMDDFGLSESAKRARDPIKAEQQMPQSIAEKVTAVGHRPTGELVVTLANGQVWYQLEPNTMARVGVGDEVTIRKASLGSYMLVTPNKVAMRVRRAK